MKTHTAGFDGSATPNPGQMMIGGWIRDPSGKQIYSFSRAIGEGTNNIAEYQALLTLLKEARKLGIKNISIQGDSALIINQVKGIWKARDPRMVQYKNRVHAVLKHMDWELHHVLRRFNKEADSLT